MTTETSQVIPQGRVLHYSPSPVGRPNTTIVYSPLGNNQRRAPLRRHPGINKSTGCSGTATQQLPTFSITPKVWRQETSGDVLVYTGPTEVCTGRATCVATGNYTPTDDKKYFANATVLYTVPVTTANGVAGGTQQYASATMNAGGGDTSNALNVVAFKVGEDEYNPNFIDIVQIEKQMGYTPVYYDGTALNVRETIKSLLPSAKVFMLNGHGAPGLVEIDT